MLFSLTNPEIAILMMGIFLFAVLLGFPIAFTLLAMGVGFGYYAYFEEGNLFLNKIFYCIDIPKKDLALLQENPCKFADASESLSFE